MAINDYWNPVEKKIDAFFFKWDDLELIYLRLERKIENYRVIPFDSQFREGKSDYIKIAIAKNDKEGFNLSLLRIDSKRIRKSLKDASDKVEKFPAIIALSRLGSGYNTTYYSSTNVSQDRLKNEIQSEIDDYLEIPEEFEKPDELDAIVEKVIEKSEDSAIESVNKKTSKKK